MARHVARKMSYRMSGGQSCPSPRYRLLFAGIFGGDVLVDLP